ncbi:hypothetical protein KAU93_03145, partial [Candidatus Bathyarchaeota archaeon]|nr:hypothetical protein [Candidatus Bathyarchaeota archaeon]
MCSTIFSYYFFSPRHVNVEERLSMFTPPLDALLMFMVATPAVGWVAYKKGYRKVQGVYASACLVVVAYLLYGLYKEVAEKGVVLIV